MAQWRKQTLAQALVRAARRSPSRGSAGDRRAAPHLLRPGESARQVAISLHALGVKRGDHVALCMGNSLEWVQFFYGAAAIGAITVPVNTRFKADELRYCLRQSDAKTAARR